jgi:hypothetical protein
MSAAQRRSRSAADALQNAALAAVVGYTAVGIRNVLRSARWKAEARRTFAALEEAGPAEASAHFFLLVPALREQNVIEGTLKHLRSLRYPADRFEIVVAVDVKEAGPRDTAQVVREYRDNNPDGAPVRLVTYRGGEQRRSLQLNAALAWVRADLARRPRRGRVLIGVYDADSRPEPESLAYIDGLARDEPEARAFQQTVTYLENHRELMDRPLVHANAVYQSLWNHSLEIPRLLASRDRLAAGRSLPYPPYCMGHGEFFDLDTLVAVGGFPHAGPCDGIQIGFALSRAGVAIHPVPFDDSCQSPTTPAAIRRQHTFWYSGNLQFVRWYTPGSRVKGTVLPVLTHCVLAGKWLVRPGVVALALAGAQRRFGPGGPTALAALIYAYYGIGARAVARTSPPEAAAAVREGRTALLPLAAGFKSLGAGAALVRMLRGESTANKVER